MTWYERTSRVNGQTKEQLTPQIAAMLKGQKAERRSAPISPGWRQRYAAKIVSSRRASTSPSTTTPPRAGEAPITIVEFSDYQCPYCSRAEATVQDVPEEVRRQDPAGLRDYPLSFHQNAQVAAEASECAKDQGKYLEMHSRCSRNQAKLAEADLIEDRRRSRARQGQIQELYRFREKEGRSPERLPGWA